MITNSIVPFSANDWGFSNSFISYMHSIFSIFALFQTSQFELKANLKLKNVHKFHITTLRPIIAVALKILIVPLY